MRTVPPLLLSEFAVFSQHPPAEEGRLPAAGDFGEVKFIGSAGVDHGNPVIILLPDEVGGNVRLMNMPMDHDGRMILIQQGTEAFKPLMGQILLVAKAADR